MSQFYIVASEGELIIHEKYESAVEYAQDAALHDSPDVYYILVPVAVVTATTEIETLIVKGPPYDNE